jgi:hypothetical protein
MAPDGLKIEEDEFMLTFGFIENGGTPGMPSDLGRIGRRRSMTNGREQSGAADKKKEAECGHY